MSADSGDGWVRGPGGEVRWGRHGAAGLLLHDPARGVLLQRRSALTQNGGTWSIPGGARRKGESAVNAALREANEEAGIQPSAVSIRSEHVLDLGWWSYTTVIAETAGRVDARIADWESSALEWVPIEAVAGGKLHPGFAASWPELRPRLSPEAAL